MNLMIPELGQNIECYVLENTPPVCSVGRRCMDEDYDFHWYAGKPPYFITPEAKMQNEGSRPGDWRRLCGSARR